MITLTIKKSDDSIYWIERFSTIEEANKWLNDEKEKSYWDKSYTWELVDDTPSSEQLAQIEADIAESILKNNTDKASGAAKLKLLASLTNDEVKALFGI